MNDDGNTWQSSQYEYPAESAGLTQPRGEIMNEEGNRGGAIFWLMVALAIVVAAAFFVYVAVR